MQRKEPYTIGLDIGTNSVGWVVMKDNYDLVKRRMPVRGDTDKKSIKKNFWGVRLFDSGKTAEKRRLQRTTRRRYARRRNRLLYLQEMFLPEIQSIDPYFFHRLNESFLVEEDKLLAKHPIFSTLDEEKQYHIEYPTIYHLRKKLADSNEKADIRLVYMALAHIIKYRGHYLIEGQLSIKNSSITNHFSSFLDEFNLQCMRQSDTVHLQECIPWSDVDLICKENISRSKRAERLLTVFGPAKANSLFGQFIKIIIGLKGNFKKYFQLDEDLYLQFGNEDSEEQMSELITVLGEDFADVFNFAKNVYESIELAGIMTVNDPYTKAKLSASMIQRYDDHQKDLKLLKIFIRDNLPEEYDNIFKNTAKQGYAGYIRNAKNTSQEKFYKYLMKLISGRPGAEAFEEKIAAENFLRKQRAYDNGAIPHQIHLQELSAIILQQGVYYPFLKKYKEHIESLVTFRIPYYVGPLARGNSQFSWLERKSNDPIRPWNLSNIVDLNKSATAFIDRMTNYDLYLPQEKVLPKQSMLYQKYTVFNELTKISYANERGIVQYLSSQEKMLIFEQLFKKKRNVTKKDVIQLLNNEFILGIEELNGLDTDKFNAKYNTYQDLQKKGVPLSLLEDPKYHDVFEEIVKVLTIFEDRKMIRHQLKKYSFLNNDTLKKLEKRSYNGWGRLSKKMINGIRDSETQKTILDYLINDDGATKNHNRNFMQLINDDDLSFKKKIEQAQLPYENKDYTDIVADLAGSPAIKKGILQSLKIVDEIEEIMGHAPKSIVIEMARENQTTEQGRKASRMRMKKIEDGLKPFTRNALLEDPTTNDKLLNNRLFLYYLQNGQDMYDGQTLDISNLSNYHIDHVIPRSITTDNSIDNLVLVKSEENCKKMNDVPDMHIVKKMRSYWERLLDTGLMSKRKFDHLTKAERGGITEADKAGFIQRQLVETRQITKNVAKILDQKYNQMNDSTDKVTKDVEVITLKAVLTSEFRHSFELYKVREVNDFHHAHDAYLNAVIGQTLLKVYPKLKPEFVYGEYHRFDAYKENRATAKQQLYTNIMHFFKNDENKHIDPILWNKERDLKMIKKVLSYHQMNITRKIENRALNEDGKELFKETIDKRDGVGKNCIKTKFKRSDNSEIELDIEKYGGYKEEKEAFIAIVNGKLKSVKRTEERQYEYEKKIYRNQIFIMKDGIHRSVASLSESSKWNQLCLDQKMVNYIYLLNRYEKISKDKQIFVEQNRHLFDEIQAIVFSFIKKNKLAKLSAINIPKQLTIDQEKSVIFALLNIASRGTTSENILMTEVDGISKKVIINKRERYFDKLKLDETILVDHSVTGLYESRRKLMIK